MSRVSKVLCGAVVVLSLTVLVLLQRLLPGAHHDSSINGSLVAKQFEKPESIPASNVVAVTALNPTPATKTFDPSTAVEELPQGLPTAGEIFRAASPSVVLVKTYDADNNPLLIGSGFFAGNGTVLVTNAHVVAGATRVEYQDSAEQIHPISGCVAIDVGGDLALLSASGPPIKFATRVPQVGDHVFVIGNPKGLTQSFSDGLISSVRKTETNQVLQITAPISPGSSGGPVLDTTGQVIGVASFFYEGGENLNFAISTPKILSLLKDGVVRPIGEVLAAAAQVSNSKWSVGRSRVEMTATGQSSPPTWNKCSVTLENHEDFPVGAVLLRIFYYVDTVAAINAQIAQLQGNIQQFSDWAKTDQVAAVRAQLNQQQEYLKILARDPTSWDVDDLPSLPQSLEVTAQLYIQFRGQPYPGDWLVQLRIAIPQVKRNVEEQIAKLGSQIEYAKNQRQINQANWDKALAEIARLQTVLQNPVKAKPVDYEDVVVSVNVENGLTRTVDVPLTRLRPGWRSELLVMDYEVQRPQSVSVGSAP
jgi:S1-C subfamily serine protease